MAATETLATCRVCNAPGLETVGSIAGFVAGHSFDVLQCEACGSQCVPEDTEVPDGLYEAIYQHANELPGYYRYQRYANEVDRLRRPLYYLTRSEDVYWAVESVLLDRKRRGLGTTVVDIGCGLGYLTAALRRAGYDAWGIDISAEAVDAANARFGPWFVRADATELTSTTSLVPDVLVALELVEHVTEPAELLRSFAGQVTDQGEVVVSTPNKDRTPAGRVWETDLPPVHLHWFSEQGLRDMGDRVDCDVELVDFTSYNRMMAKPPAGRVRPERDGVKSMLDEHMRPTGYRAPTPKTGPRDRLVRSPLGKIPVAAVRLVRRFRTRNQPADPNRPLDRQSNSAVARYRPRRGAARA